MDESERNKRSTANAVGGRTARACDCCLRRRARWYCGADDAFLCQACDASVHSANSLARRHQRLRLHTASSSPPPSPPPPPISWHKRKARTPRSYQQPKPGPSTPVKPESLVPDLDVDEDELEMHLMCRVPVLDPLFNDFDSSNLEMDLGCLLGVGLDDVHESSLYMDEEDANQIKMEFDFDAMGVEMELYDEAQGDGVASVMEASLAEKEGDGEGVIKKMGLRLDYDAIIDAWSRSGSSPWASGGQPHIDSDGCLQSFMGTTEGEAKWSKGRWEVKGGVEREARVTRYREKRRTRLFAKKIRYEVRKLNAEKRPRLKGRFVKRTTLSAGTGPAPYQY